jgi:PAS domain S-box-containing protein
MYQEAQRSAIFRRLVESEAVLSSLVAHSSDGIVLFDRSGSILEWNPAQERITGLRREAVFGLPIWEVEYLVTLAERRTGDYRAQIKAFYEDYFNRQEARQESPFEELELERPDGTRRIVQSRLFPVPGPEGELFGVICRDITEQRNHDAALARRQKLESIGLLAGGVAHDFNNIFQAVLFRIELAAEMLDPDHPARQQLTKAVPPIERCAELTGQLLAYAGKGQYLMEDVDLGQFLRENENLFRAALPRHVRLHLELASDLPPIRADRAQIQQVLLHLLLNAGEAIPPGSGTVWLRTGCRTLKACDEGSFVVGAAPLPGIYEYLEVIDSGTGMAAATLARVCEPFFSTRFTGRGLGLPAVMGIMRTHGGGLRLESRPGAGTVVTVVWPVALAKPVMTVEPAAQPEAQAQSAQDRRTVLVVEDVRELRETLARVIEAEGLPALGAANGQDAVRIFRDRHLEIGLVILDLQMAVMNGDAAFREMHDLDSAVPVLLSTGYDEPEARRRLAASQVAARPDGFLQKPYRVQDLLAEINRLLPH